VLKAGGKLLPGIAVDWSIEGKTITVTSNAEGKVLFKQGFQEAGTHLVTAKVSRSGQTTSFTVRASMLIFDVKWSAENNAALIPLTPNLRFRLHRYAINVRILDPAGTPVEGIRFRLTADSKAQQNGIHIDGLGVEKTSTREGTNYTMTTEYATSPALLELTLAGTPVQEWSHTYQLGWLYEPASAHYAASLKQLNVRYHSVSPTHLPAPQSPFLPILLRIPARGWVGSLYVFAALETVVADRFFPSLIVYKGDKILSPFHTSIDEFVVLLAGEVVVK
jgi:hypothetical protein